MPVADGHRVPALGDGAGEEGHAEGLERGAGDASRTCSRSSARSSPAAASCRPSTRSSSSNVGWWFIAYIADRRWRWRSTLLITRTSTCCAREHRMESLVSREATFLFNNLLFVGARVRRAVGRHCSRSISEARDGRPDHGQRAVLQLLRRRVRPAADAADGRRAGDRLAPRVAARACAPRFGWPFAIGAAAGLGLIAARLRRASRRHRRLLAVGVRGRHDRARVRPRHVGAQGARRRLVAERVRARS